MIWVKCLPPLEEASDDECDEPDPDDDDWFVELFDKFNEAISLLALDAWFVTRLALPLLLCFDAADAFDDADEADEDASDELEDDDDPSESLNKVNKWRLLDRSYCVTEETTRMTMHFMQNTRFVHPIFITYHCRTMSRYWYRHYCIPALVSAENSVNTIKINEIHGDHCMHSHAILRASEAYWLESADKKRHKNCQTPVTSY